MSSNPINGFDDIDAGGSLSPKREQEKSNGWLMIVFGRPLTNCVCLNRPAIQESIDRCRNLPATAADSSFDVPPCCWVWIGVDWISQIRLAKIIAASAMRANKELEDAKSCPFRLLRRFWIESSFVIFMLAAAAAA